MKPFRIRRSNHSLQILNVRANLIQDHHIGELYPSLMHQPAFDSFRKRLDKIGEWRVHRITVYI